MTTFSQYSFFELQTALVDMDPEVISQLQAIMKAAPDILDLTKEGPPPGELVEAQAKVQVSTDLNKYENLIKSIPLRLTACERNLLEILEAALRISEYTDVIDVYLMSGTRRNIAVKTEFNKVLNHLHGLVSCHLPHFDRYVKGTKDQKELLDLYTCIFEIGRRYKILNPEAMRDTYGKLICIVQDAHLVGGPLGHKFEVDIQTVDHVLAHKTHKTGFLQDPLLHVALTSTEAPVRESAVQQLLLKYAEDHKAAGATKVPFGFENDTLVLRMLGASPLATFDNEFLTTAEIQYILHSLGDYERQWQYATEPIRQIRHLLEHHFDPIQGTSLIIRRGIQGSQLTHSHAEHFTFVRQSLVLWEEIMNQFTQLWFCADSDLVRGKPYQLCDNGQGLCRLQGAPLSANLMRTLLADIKHQERKAGHSWIGLSVVHFEDRDVPNALYFIDKYMQLPRITWPILHTLNFLPEEAAKSRGLQAFLQKYGGLEGMTRHILEDFFKHAFNGSGDDGGSCIDGRLTSTWNWCSLISKKPFMTCFLITGFTGFDGH